MTNSLILKICLVCLIIVNGSCSSNHNPQPKERKLIWSDEFNYSGLPDATKWSYDIGDTDGWGNNELEYYTHADTSNAVVRNGYLYITARKQKKKRVIILQHD